MENKKKNNALYGGEIPEGWEIGPMASLVKEIISGVSVNGEERTITENEFGVLKVSSVSYDFFDPNEYKVINKKEIAKAKVNPEAGTVIMSRANTPELVGANVLITENYPNLFLSDKLWQIKVKSEKFDIVWFSYLLKLDVVKKTISGNATGSSKSMRNITQESFLMIPCILPPLPEQRAIAACLSTWDAAIQKTTQLIAQKELRKKWLMQQLLTGKKRLKGFEGEWREVRMKDVFERVTRKNIEGNTNVVTISAQRGFVRQDDFFNKIVASEILDNYFLVQKGEFCYNKSYSNGYPRGATKRLNDFDKAVVTTLYICFSLMDECNSGDFFEQYFEANLLDKGLTKIAHEGGRAHGLLNVTPSDFFDLKITIPVLKEQKAIAQVLLTADNEIQLLKARAEKMKEQKKGMMQQLLTGKKRLKHEKDI